MAKPSLLLGFLTVLFTVIFGLAAYLLINPKLKIRKNKKLIEAQENHIIEMIKKTEQKRAALEDFSKKIKRVRKKLRTIKEVKELKKAFREEHKKNYELEMKIKRLEHNLKAKTVKQTVEKPKPQMPTKAEDNDETAKIKQKYPSLPKNQLERIEIERSIARSLMRNNGGSFYVSQILRSIEEIYPKYINPNGRIMLLNEIKNWIERDPLCRAVKTTDKIQHYTFI